MVNLFKSKKSNTSKSEDASSRLSLKKSKNNETQKEEVMKDAQRETCKFQQKTQELGMTELIKNHKVGERFLYAAITNKNQEENSSILRRLVQFQPKMSRTSIPVENLPRLDLFDEVETFKLESIIPKKPGKNTFIHISEIMILYGSLISTEDMFSKVRVSIIDDRKLNDKVARSFAANTNLCSRAVMQMPYCFPRNEVDAISLTLSRESAFLEQGRQWGAAQVMISIKELNFPEQYSSNPVNALNNLPESMFEKHETDPSHIDISIMNNDKDKLFELLQSGDIMDETSPLVDKFENVKYGKSVMRNLKGKKVETPRTKDWEYINEKRISCKQDENSISCNSDESDESESPSIRAMKLSRLEYERNKNRQLNMEKAESSSKGVFDNGESENHLPRSAMKRSVRIVDPTSPIIHTL